MSCTEMLLLQPVHLFATNISTCLPVASDQVSMSQTASCLCMCHVVVCSCWESQNALHNVTIAKLGLDMQVPAIMAQDSDRSTEAAGNMGRTARMVTELAETSHELKHYLGANNALLERYSHELLHVQSLAAQLVQMSSMQQLSSHEIL